MATMHKRQPDRFDLLLAEKKLSPETARKCGDLPKVPLPLGVKLVRIPVELVEDPFKGKPPSNAEEEYKTLHQNFYEKVRKILATVEPKPTNSPVEGETISTTGGPGKVPVEGDQVRVQMSGPKRDVKINVTKKGVEATVAIPPKP